MLGLAMFATDNTFGAMRHGSGATQYASGLRVLATTTRNKAENDNI